MKRLLSCLGLTAATLLASAALAQNPDTQGRNNNTQGNAQSSTQTQSPSRNQSQNDTQRNTSGQTQNNLNRTDNNRTGAQGSTAVQPGSATQTPKTAPGTIQQGAATQTPNTAPGTIQQGAATQTNTNGQQLQGQIVQTANDHFIVRTQDGRQVTVYTNPQTRYLQGNNPVQYSNLQAGANISTLYGTQGGRYYANTVTLVPAGGTTTQVAPAQGTVLQGQVVRVIGTDQVLIRTNDGREIPVYVTPQTTYTFNDQPGQFTNLQPGTPIGVNYNVTDQRHMASRIFGLPRR